jgi:hypothetical protein
VGSSLLPGLSSNLHGKPAEAEALVRELARAAADRRQLLEEVLGMGDGEKW